MRTDTGLPLNTHEGVWYFVNTRGTGSMYLEYLTKFSPADWGDGVEIITYFAHYACWGWCDIPQYDLDNTFSGKQTIVLPKLISTDDAEVLQDLRNGSQYIHLKERNDKLNQMETKYRKLGETI